MTKQDILNTTGLSEEEFYQRYPDQETFCSEYPDMCPDMMEDDEEEDISNYQNLGYDESEINMAAYGGSLYEAQDGVQQPAPYTDYNQYQKAMQNYGAEASKAGTYNNFQNDLYNQSGKSRGFSETTSQLGDMFNTLSPEQQDAMAAKYNAEFITNTPSGNRRNYVNSMEMNVPGKGTGYYSFPTNDVAYGSKQLERPKYDLPAMTMAPYKMPVAPLKKFSVEPTQLINNIGASYKNPTSLNASNNNLPIPKYSMTNTMEKVGATNKPYVASAPNYTSIIDLLKARKQDSSFTNRKKLAEEAGIKNYTGSASQNMDFINRINGINSSSAEMELGGVNIHPAMRTNFKQGGYYNTNNNLNKFQFAGPVTDNLIYRKPIYTAPILKKNNLSLEELQALAHQKTGMGSLNGSYVKQHNPIMNDLGNLSPNDLKELQNYMDSRGALEYLYQILPNAGLIYGNSAAELPKNSKLKYKQGGYYGMDGKLHKAKGSGTYVMNGGYYFEPGGTSTAPPVASPNTPPGAMGDPASVPPSSLIDKNMPNADGTFNIDPNETYNFEDTPENSTGDFGSDGTVNARQQRRQARRNAPYEMNDLGGLDPAYEQQDEQPVIEPYDPSQYSSAIDPVTGFTNYSKNNKVIKNIKRDENALWQQLKEEGNGARFRTGQTDVQKFGRAAGKVAATGDALINVAGAFGNLIDSQNEQRNLNNSAINKGSTASMYTNPQSAGKGDYGQTGSSYGMMNPSSVGARSFKGMYGKYGMEVPKYDIGGFVPQISTLSDVGLESMAPESINVTSDYLPSFTPTGFAVTPRPVVDNTGVYQNNRAVNDNQPVDNNQGNSNTPIVNKRGGSDVATRLNNPRNLIYNPVFSKLFGAKKSSTKQTDGSGYFAEFPSIEAGLKAAETQLFGETDGIFKSNYYNPDTDINKALKTWSGGGYGIEIYPEIKGKTLSQITAAERRELQRRQIKRESGAMYKVLEENGVFNNTNKTNNYTPSSNYAPSNTNFSLKNLMDFAKTNKWVVTSTTGGRHNPGSRHGKARAIDVSVKNKTPQQISDFMKLAQSQGYRVLDERVRPKGQKEWHGAHLHLDFEKGGQFGGQVMEMDEDEIKQFLKAGGQLEFLD